MAVNDDPWVYYDDTGTSAFACLASGFGAAIISESCTIVQICQDPNNLNIVYLDMSLAGAFEYDIALTANWIDSNDETHSVDLNSAFIPNYKNTGIEALHVDPSCGESLFKMAFNCGSKISEFASLPAISFTVTTVGYPTGDLIQDLYDHGVDQATIDELSSEVLVSENPGDIKTLEKGITPDPYLITWDPITTEMQIQYLAFVDTICSCSINCVTADEADFPIVPCEDGSQVVTVESNSIIGDPTDITMKFVDAIGNTSSLYVHAMAGVIPAPPSVLVKGPPRHSQISVFYKSTNEATINSSKVFVQIWKYVGNQGNAKVWKDWTEYSWKTVFDKDIKAGKKYGYAVKFKGQFKEESYLSPWTTITV
jgi:hypothetical protein